MKAIYFSPVKIAGQGVEVYFPLHRQSYTDNSGAQAEIKTMSQRIQPARGEAGGKQTLELIVHLKVAREDCFSVKPGDLRINVTKYD